MESSKLKGKTHSKLYDPFRCSWVAAAPEEIVRQKLLHLMTTQLGYPKALIAVEVQLSQIPHLRGRSSLPKRRADIICFGKGVHSEHPLYPLLMIECKERVIGKEAISQVVGYNHFVEAHFVAIAGEGVTHLVYPEEVPFLPTFSQLMERVCL